MLSANLAPIWLPCPFPSLQPPILFITAVAHEKSAFCLERIDLIELVLEIRRPKRVKIFSLLAFSSTISIASCDQVGPVFSSKSSFLSIHSSALREGSLHTCHQSLALEAGATPWVLASGLRTQAAKNACHLVSRARLRPKEQITSTAERFHAAFIHFFTDPQVFCTFGVLHDFVNATVDVFQVEFALSSNKSRIPVNMRAPAISTAVAVHAFKKQCNFADCDSICSVSCFDHNSTPTLTISFFFC